MAMLRPVLLAGFLACTLPAAWAAPAQWYVDAVVKGIWCGYPTACPANDLRPFTGSFTYDSTTGVVSNVAIQYRGATWTYGRRVSSRALAFHPASSANFTGSSYVQIYLAPGYDDPAGTYAVGPYPWTLPAAINEAQCLNSACTSSSQMNADGVSGTVSRTRIDAVDPNTSALRSLVTGTGDLAALAAANAAKGLVADGVTPLVLRWRGGTASPVAISITDEGSGTADIGTLGCVAGMACALGSPTTAVITPVQLADGSYLAAAVLVAPMEFVRSTADEAKGAQSPRQVRLSAQVSGDPGLPATGQLELHRPPLVLLHGLWSEGPTWSLGVQGDVRFFTGQPFDYRGSNAATFAANMVVPRAAVADAVVPLRQAGIAATRADVVGHSMGGILSRLYIAGYKNAAYRRADNFQGGDIHKLITLDTPHAGSELANQLVDGQGQLLPFGSLMVEYFDDKCVTCGAVGDLRIGSAPNLAMPRADVAAHAIVGTGGSDFLGGGIDCAADATTKGIANLGKYDPNGYLGIAFGQQAHDLIVSEHSQEGRLASGYTTTFGLVADGACAMHTTVTRDPRVSTRVIQLLNARTDSALFASYLPAAGTAQLQFQAQDVRFAPQALPQTLQITSPLPGTVVAPGEVVPVSIAVPPGMTPGVLLVLSPAGVAVLEGGATSGQFTVSADVVGPVTLKVLGVDVDGQASAAAPVTITVATASPLNALATNYAAMTLTTATPARQLTVTGTWGDGAQRDLTAPGTGTTYASGNAAVATVTAGGLVTGRQQGNTTIEVANGALGKTVNVTVTEPIADTDADGVPDAADNCTLLANPEQCDSDGDGYGNRCDGDLNNNGATNAQDTTLFRARLGQPSVAPGYDIADFNCNGAVNAQDTTLFRGLLGQPAGPSGLVGSP